MSYLKERNITGKTLQVQQTLAEIEKKNQLLISLESLAGRPSPTSTYLDNFLSYFKSEDQLRKELVTEILTKIVLEHKEHGADHAYDEIISVTRKYINLVYHDGDRKKARDIAGALFYYLTRREVPDQLKCLLMGFVSSPGPIFGVIARWSTVKESYSPPGWSETCSLALSHSDTFVRFYVLLDFNPSALEDFLYANTDLLMNEYTSRLFNQVATYLDPPTLRRIFSTCRDNRNRTTFFFLNGWALDTLATIYQSHVEELYDLLAIYDGKGYTALHVNTKAIADLLLRTYSAENWKRIYSLFSIQDKEGNTALHLSADLMENLLVIYQPIYFNNIHTLLQARNDQKATVMYNVKSSKHFVMFYKNHISDLYELLFLQNRSGHTALHANACVIAELLVKTDAADSFEMFYKLLMVQDKHGCTALHYHNSVIIDLLMNTNSAENPEKLYQLLSLQNQHGCTFLFLHRKMDAIAKLWVTHYLPEHFTQVHCLLSKIRQSDSRTIMFKVRTCEPILMLYEGHAQDLFELLSVQDVDGYTALHSNTKVIVDLLAKIGSAISPDYLYMLLSMQDNCGRTALHDERFADDILELLLDSYSIVESNKLYQLITIKDNDGCPVKLTKNMKTLLWKVSDSGNPKGLHDFYQLLGNWYELPISSFDDEVWILEIIMSVYLLTELDSFLHFFLIISATNSSQLSEWIREQALNTCYLIYHEPTVLILYTTQHREGAEKEAQCIANAFKSIKYLNARMEKDKSKDETFQLIKQLVSEAKSSLIVVIMSHGNRDSITDSKGVSIKFDEIEEAMCRGDNLRGKPKVLITQCCRVNANQGVVSQLVSRFQDAPGTSTPKHKEALKKYEVINDHFIAIMSTVGGTLSQRNLFIPDLAKQISQCKKNECIVDMARTASRLMGRKSSQIPIFAGTLRGKFCLANYFRLLMEV